MILTEERPRKKPLRTQTLRMIDPEEYCQLAISLRSLERCDDPVSGLRMLRDKKSGELFAVEDARLSKHHLGQL